MDFLDSLKNIKKEMQTHTKDIKKEKKQNKQEKILDKEMQEIFLKEEKLQDEFSEFIKNSDIKKI
ncbi:MULTISPECIES: hypothetical protein [Campylobacter]|uniref:Uncharacterized protein n=1 Tax=Campylobacter taeniopygiae TaxID=2510188 RepID=A0ABY2TJX3_9BACT|nr:hypothetical protein [Campylobacter taeniopygiae]MBZ7964181.1 hypothetical protein [Campylobacter sp. 2457A]TKX34410.1 hypothetical protein CQA75_01975 [Campylobacter taeniopygiae]